MKKIGRETLFLRTDSENQRNGEGTFIRLKNNSILYAYTRFTGGKSDDGAADIAAVYSYDEGNTWTEPEILLPRSENSANIMCPTLMRMANGDLGLFYLIKTRPSESSVCLVRSADEGRSFSEPVFCTPPKGHYAVLENDHIIRLKNGRIIIPINHHSVLCSPDTDMTGIGTMVCMGSDDDGRTWKQLCRPIQHPHDKFTSHGMQETVLYQHEDGKIRALSRSEYGCQYQCFSYDMGEHWTEVHPNTFFTSPPSPLIMKKIKNLTLAVWNPIPQYTTRDKKELWGRTPLVMAVSRDDGNNFDEIYALEDDLTNNYCYPAIFGDKDYILAAYYHSDNSDFALNANKIIKIELSEL